MKTLCLGIACLFCLHLNAQTIYAVDQSDGFKFGIIHPEDGSFTTLHAFKENIYRINSGSASDPNAGYYFVEVKDENEDHFLYTIDISTGDVLYEPALSEPLYELNYSCHFDLLFGFEYTDTATNMVSINHMTGETTLLASYPEIDFLYMMTGSYNEKYSEFLCWVKLVDDDNYYKTMFDIPTGEILLQVEESLQFENLYNCNDGLYYSFDWVDGIPWLTTLDPYSGISTPIIEGAETNGILLSSTVLLPDENKFVAISDNLDYNYEYWVFDITAGTFEVTEPVSGFMWPQEFLVSYCCAYLDIQTQTTTSPLTVYPNPASSYITITPQLLPTIERYTIISMNGSIVLEGDARMESAIDVSDLANGMYQLKVEMGDGVVSGIFVKE